MEKEREVREELREVRGLLEAILARLDERPSQAPEPARADDLVDVEYFAVASGLSRVTILQGKAGTDAVHRASKRPSRWRKGDVDRWVRERAAALRSPKQKALTLLDRGGRRGKRPAA